MGSTSFAWRWMAPTLASTIAAVGLSASQVQRPQASSQKRQHILIHMKEYVSEVHEAQMGLELADRLQSSGTQVTLWLELRAVRIADDRIDRRRNPQPGSRSFNEIYKSFVDHGGRILVCHHCAEFDEIGSEHVRAGARLVGVDDVAQAVIEADKILDY